MTQISQVRKRRSVMESKKFLILVDLLKTDYNAKVTEIESKIISISGIATSATLTAVKNKIPNVVNLARNIKH